MNKKWPDEPEAPRFANETDWCGEWWRRCGRMSYWYDWKRCLFGVEISRNLYDENGRFPSFTQTNITFHVGPLWFDWESVRYL